MIFSPEEHRRLDRIAKGLPDDSLFGSEVQFLAESVLRVTQCLERWTVEHTARERFAREMEEEIERMRKFIKDG
jgi:hypothetical protein